MSTSNDTLIEVRSELFKALRGLNDPDKPMDIERARAVSDVAQTIINSAKVEIDHLKLAGGKGTGFIPEATTPGLPGDTQVVGGAPGVRVLRHTLRG